MMSNKIFLLLLPNYFIQSSINYVINITKLLQKPNCYACVLCVEVLEFKIPGQSNLIQRCKRFVTASTSTQVYLSVLPWRDDGEMSTANSYMLHRNTSIMKGLRKGSFHVS